MTLDGKTIVQKYGHNGIQIRIPTAVRSDSQCPLHVGDVVKIEVDGKKLTATPI